MIRLTLAIIFVFCVPAVVLSEQQGTVPGTPPSQGSPQTKDPVLSVRPAPAPPVVDGRIKLDVVVTGQQGRAVSGLEVKDFTVLDNKQVQTILGFHAASESASESTTPVEVILLLDAVNSRFQQAAIARQQISKFLLQNEGHLAYPTSIALFTKEGLRIQPRPSRDGNALAQALNHETASVDNSSSAAAGYGEIERFQISVRTLTAIAENEVKKPGRKMLIWTGPGWPLLVGSNFASSAQDRQRNFDAIVEVTTRLREAHIALYSISPFNPAAGGSAMRMGASGSVPLGVTTGPEAPPAPHSIAGDSGAVDGTSYKEFLKGVKSAKQADSANLALQVLAVQSGGRVLSPNNDLVDQISNCLEDLRAFYTISFDPAVAQHADEYHELKVVVSTPGLTAHTSSGYYNQ